MSGKDCGFTHTNPRKKTVYTLHTEKSNKTTSKTNCPDKITKAMRLIQSIPAITSKETPLCIIRYKNPCMIMLVKAVFNMIVTVKLTRTTGRHVAPRAAVAVHHRHHYSGDQRYVSPYMGTCEIEEARNTGPGSEAFRSGSMSGNKSNEPKPDLQETLLNLLNCHCKENPPPKRRLRPTRDCRNKLSRSIKPK